MTESLADGSTTADHLSTLVLERPAVAPREALLAVAHARVARAVRVPTPAGPDDLAALDRLVALTRGHVDAATHVHLLRAAGASHLAVADAQPTTHPRAPRHPGGADGSGADPHLDELLAVVRGHGLTLFRADAQVLLARRALLAGDQEAALAAATTALAHLDEPVLADAAPSPAEHRENVRRSFRLVAGVLVSLGLHELAHESLRRGRDTAHPDDTGTVALGDYEQVRVDVSWGLRRQRAGRDGSAALRDAATTARRLAADAAAAGWDASRTVLLDAAVALDHHQRGLTDDPPREARPTDPAIPVATVPVAASMHDHLVARIARARSLAHAGRHGEAVAVLEPLLAASPRGEPDLLISAQRELARLRIRGADAALAAYTDALEAELWSLREARAASLRTRVAHEKLRREHGEVTAAAFTDQLTGLPNRRALEATLSRLLATGPAGRPGARGQVSVAVVDVDRFKLVNDRMTHAAGDEVLRTVAGILARSLRTGDVVARFGGDEFVAVLPGCRAGDAAVALHRAVRETAATAIEDGTSVSLSVGIAEMFPGPGPFPSAPHHDHRPDRSPDHRPDPRPHPAPDRPAGPPRDRHGLAGHEVLVRADAVMYAAKRAGGDAVWVERGVRLSGGTRS